MSSPRPAAVSMAAADRPLALALDIGSSSVRAILHDRQGRPIAGGTVQSAYRMQIEPDGGVHVAVDELRLLVEAAIDELSAACAAALADVAVVGTACFSHSLVGLGADGEPITPVLSWADTTSAEAAAGLRQRLDGQTTWRRTGAPIHASYWPARIAHQRATAPAVTGWIGFGELVGGWLTGRRAASISIASATGLLDGGGDDWDRQLLEALHISPAALPELVLDDQPLGSLTGDYRRRWPALAGATWFPAWTDGACGNVGLDCRGPDRAALMIGTSSALRVLLGRPDIEPPAGLFRFRLGSRAALLGGQLSEGGGTAAWVSRLTGRPLAELDRLAESVAPVEHGLAMLPYLSGERGPGYHAGARAMVAGLTLASGPAELFRAALEAVALGLARIDDLLGAALGQPPAVVAAGGAVAGSKLWPQILADAIGRPIQLPEAAAEPSARGAALLALDYAGLGRTDVGLAGRDRRLDRIVEPDLRRHELYRTLAERRAQLYESAAAEWE